MKFQENCVSLFQDCIRLRYGKLNGKIFGRNSKVMSILLSERGYRISAEVR